MEKSIIRRHLQERIQQLMQINDKLVSATKETDIASLQQTRLMIASAVYALSVLVSEL